MLLECQDGAPHQRGTPVRKMLKQSLLLSVFRQSRFSVFLPAAVFLYWMKVSVCVASRSIAVIGVLALVGAME
jgi:hypothetical protein